MGMLLRQYHDQEDGTRKPGAEVKGPERKGSKRNTKRAEDRTEGAKPGPEAEDA